MQMILKTGMKKQEEEYRRRKRKRRDDRNANKRGPGRGVTIAALILGAVLLGIVACHHKSTLVSGKERSPGTNGNQQKQEEQSDKMVAVPDLGRKTEAEAKELASSLHIGVQMIG